MGTCETKGHRIQEKRKFNKQRKGLLGKQSTDVRAFRPTASLEGEGGLEIACNAGTVENRQGKGIKNVVTYGEETGGRAKTGGLGSLRD